MTCDPSAARTQPREGAEIRISGLSAAIVSPEAKRTELQDRQQALVLELERVQKQQANARSQIKELQAKLKELEQARLKEIDAALTPEQLARVKELRVEALKARGAKRPAEGDQKAEKPKTEGEGK